MNEAVLDRNLQGASTESQVEELVAECDQSMELFCQTFFPDLFFKPFSKVIHSPIFDVLDDDSIQLAAIAAPRGVGKSTIFGNIFPVKRICYRDSDYIIPVSATGDAAVEQAADTRDALITNEAISEVFGDFTPSERSDPFGQKEWVTDTGCVVKPRGAGQQVRGRKRRGKRPDLIIIDDLEDDESVESEDRRAKLKRWLFSALLNSVDRGLKNWRVLLVGTILHEDSLLANLLDKDRYPNWTTLRLEICDDKYESNWPEHMLKEDIIELKDSYQRDGLLDVFYREFRNKAIATENQAFRQEFFQYYEETEEQINGNSDWVSMVLSDPARTMKTGSAMTSIVGVSINTVTNRVLVRDIEEDQMYPDDLYNRMFAMAARLNALILAPEVTGLNEYITYPLRNEMLRRGVFHVIVEVKPREGKTGPKRSGGLVPLYRQGLVFHNKAACGGLEGYLMQWPRPEKWDVIDALAGLIFVMEDGEEYFTPLDEDPEDEYRGIHYEEPLIVESVI